MVKRFGSALTESSPHKSTCTMSWLTSRERLSCHHCWASPEHATVFPILSPPAVEKVRPTWRKREVSICPRLSEISKGATEVSLQRLPWRRLKRLTPARKSTRALSRHFLQAGRRWKAQGREATEARSGLFRSWERRPHHDGRSPFHPASRRCGRSPGAARRARGTDRDCQRG
jgi:hypothetical protein